MSLVQFFGLLFAVLSVGTDGWRAVVLTVFALVFAVLVMAESSNDGDAG